MSIEEQTLHTNEVSFWRSKVRDIEHDREAYRESALTSEKLLTREIKEKERIKKEIVTMKRMNLHVSSRLGGDLLNQQLQSDDELEKEEEKPKTPMKNGKDPLKNGKDVVESPKVSVRKLVKPIATPNYAKETRAAYLVAQKKDKTANSKADSLASGATIDDEVKNESKPKSETKTELKSDVKKPFFKQASTKSVIATEKVEAAVPDPKTKVIKNAKQLSKEESTISVIKDKPMALKMNDKEAKKFAKEQSGISVIDDNPVSIQKERVASDKSVKPKLAEPKAAESKKVTAAAKEQPMKNRAQSAQKKAEITENNKDSKKLPKQNEKQRAFSTSSAKSISNEQSAKDALTLNKPTISRAPSHASEFADKLPELNFQQRHHRAKSNPTAPKKSESKRIRSLTEQDQLDAAKTQLEYQAYVVEKGHTKGGQQTSKTAH